MVFRFLSYTIITFALYSFPVALVVPGVFLWRKSKVRTSYLDYIGLLLPYVIWWLLELNLEEGKSLSNMCFEPILLALIVIALSVTRLFISSKPLQLVCSSLYFVATCGAAVAIWHFVPTLQE